jgi:hypothetical protein
LANQLLDSIALAQNEIDRRRGYRRAEVFTEEVG